MSAFLSVVEAQDKLLVHFSPLSVKSVQLSKSANRIIAKDLYANFDIPSFSNSGMDGFAIQAGDLAGASLADPVSLPVIGDIPAGANTTLVVGEGQAARIMTGAILPTGADSVVPVEDTDFPFGEPGTLAPSIIKIYRQVREGENVRLAGQDIRKGDCVFKSGHRIRPQDVGLMAMLGMERVPVYRKPRIAVFSSGDELLPPGSEIIPGKVYDSNTFTLTALIDSYGGKCINLGIVHDREDEIQAGLKRAVEEKVDLIVSSAGVSVGAFDFVRAVVQSHGRLEFWQVNIRPGKPIAFGDYMGISYFGLPGNPVSAFVTFEVFVRPAILKMSGVDPLDRRILRVKLLEDIDLDGRESYLRALVTFRDGNWEARLTGHQGSGNLFSLVSANALLVIPAGVTKISSGSIVNAWQL